MTERADRDARLERWCRVWLVALAIFHWLVFWLLTQTVTSSASDSSVPPMRSLAYVSDTLKASPVLASDRELLRR